MSSCWSPNVGGVPCSNTHWPTGLTIPTLTPPTSSHPGPTPNIPQNFNKEAGTNSSLPNHRPPTPLPKPAPPPAHPKRLLGKAGVNALIGRRRLGPHHLCQCLHRLRNLRRCVSTDTELAKSADDFSGGCVPQKARTMSFSWALDHAGDLANVQDRFLDCFS